MNPLDALICDIAKVAGIPEKLCLTPAPEAYVREMLPPRLADPVIAMNHVMLTMRILDAPPGSLVTAWWVTLSILFAAIVFGGFHLIDTRKKACIEKVIESCVQQKLDDVQCKARVCIVCGTRC